MKKLIVITAIFTVCFVPSLATYNHFKEPIPMYPWALIFAAIILIFSVIVSFGLSFCFVKFKGKPEIFTVFHARYDEAEDLVIFSRKVDGSYIEEKYTLNEITIKKVEAKGVADFTVINYYPIDEHKKRAEWLLGSSESPKYLLSLSDTDYLGIHVRADMHKIENAN